MVSCCAFKCTERFKKGGTITFLRFPKDPEKRKLWELKMNRVNFKAAECFRICSKHFTPDSFERTTFGYSRLKPDSFPTIFDYYEQPPDESLQEAEADVKPSIKVKKEKTEKKRLHYLGDFDENDIKCPAKVKQFLQISQDKISNWKLTIRLLRQQNKRLKQRVASLKCELNELKEEKVISNDASPVLIEVTSSENTLTVIGKKMKEEHVCQICEKKFTVKYNLERHMQIHSKAQELSCENCHIKFSRQDALKRHLLHKRCLL